MAVEIPTKGAEPCGLEDCLAALDASGFAPGDPQSVAHAAHWLARLAANREFLGALALEQLDHAGRQGGQQGYSPQVMMLGEPRPGWFMRANIWPSHEEAVLRESGEAAFVYGLAHDHNFDFLTIGYHGPGYRSDHYEIDPEAVIGVAGERVALRPMGNSVLWPGRVMHYRARRDVHCQHAPDSLSVSINLMRSSASQRWTDQFEYDLTTSTAARVLTNCTGDTLARMALMLQPDQAQAMIETIAVQHPVARLRWSAIQALAMVQSASDARQAIYARHLPDLEGWLARRCHAAIGD